MPWGVTPAWRSSSVEAATTCLMVLNVLTTSLARFLDSTGDKSGQSRSNSMIFRSLKPSRPDLINLSCRGVRSLPSANVFGDISEHSPHSPTAIIPLPSSIHIIALLSNWVGRNCQSGTQMCYFHIKGVILLYHLETISFVLMITGAREA